MWKTVKLGDVCGIVKAGSTSAPKDKTLFEVDGTCLFCSHFRCRQDKDRCHQREQGQRYIFYKTACYAGCKLIKKK
jgi:hypothetical protein